MRLLSLLAAVPFAFALACSSASAGPPPLASVRSAGNVVGSDAPSAAAGDIAAMRAEGPKALQRLLGEYDRARDGEAKRALAATIDKVAGQRYATLSRLYWYEDLDQAKAVARATGKPILSLRMLGRLDEDLSCANSRFFRTTLYPDAAVSKLLRDKFVLHWSSERNVPRVTVDFGDGRKLESTITGNSAHYILDADGRPLDVLPGLYAPAVFARELESDMKLHASLRGKSAQARTAALIAHHQAAMDATAKRFASLPEIPFIVGSRRLLTQSAVLGAAATAQRATISKAYVEVPMLRTVNVGVDPGKLPDDIELWAEIGQQMLRIGTPPAPGSAAAFIIDDADQVDAAATAALAQERKGRPILDPTARALVDALLAAPTAGQTLSNDERAAVIARLEQTIVADTALNETRLRQQIRGYLIAELQRGGGGDFATLNGYIYDNVFHTPAADAWMGLLPRDTFTGLPAGAVISKS